MIAREHLKDPRTRLETLVEQLMPIAQSREMFPTRAFVAGAYLLGCSPDYLRAVCGGAQRRGSFAAYLEWRSRPPALPPMREPGPLPEDAYGHVYFARVQEFPHVIKIGFSRNPESRMKQLQRETGQAHLVEKTLPGTKVDEAIAHIAFFKTHIVREWFFDPKQDDRTPPPFLPPGVSEILKMLGEAA